MTFPRGDLDPFNLKRSFAVFMQQGLPEGYNTDGRWNWAADDTWKAETHPWGELHWIQGPAKRGEIGAIVSIHIWYDPERDQYGAEHDLMVGWVQTALLTIGRFQLLDFRANQDDPDPVEIDGEQIMVAVEENEPAVDLDGRVAGRDLLSGTALTFDLHHWRPSVREEQGI